MRLFQKISIYYPWPLKIKSPEGLGIHPSLSCLSSSHGFDFFISLLSRSLSDDLFLLSRRALSFFFSHILWLILAPHVLPSLCYVSTTYFLFSSLVLIVFHCHGNLLSTAGQWVEYLNWIANLWEWTCFQKWCNFHVFFYFYTMPELLSSA